MPGPNTSSVLGPIGRVLVVDLRPKLGRGYFAAWGYAIKLDESGCSITNKLKEISIDEIKAFEDGLRNEFVIHSGEKADLPVFCTTCPIILKWCFTSSCQTIPLTITHMDETCDNESAVFSQDEPKMQDEMELSLPGYYVFHFDNTFRIAELRVKYQLLLKNVSQMEESILQK